MRGGARRLRLSFCFRITPEICYPQPGGTCCGAAALADACVHERFAASKIDGADDVLEATTRARILIAADNVGHDRGRNGVAAADDNEYRKVYAILDSRLLIHVQLHGRVCVRAARQATRTSARCAEVPLLANPSSAAPSGPASVDYHPHALVVGRSTSSSPRAAPAAVAGSCGCMYRTASCIVNYSCLRLSCDDWNWMKSVEKREARRAFVAHLWVAALIGPFYVQNMNKYNRANTILRPKHAQI